MAKKLLCITILMLALVCMLASCNNSDNTPSTPENPTHTHAYGEWEIQKAATCTAEGSKDRYCSCGEKQTASVPATGHSFGGWTTIKEATFSEKGSESRQCACGKIEMRDIAKKESEVQTITATECHAEFIQIYTKMLEQKTISYTEEYTNNYGSYQFVESIYFDGNNYFLYYYENQNITHGHYHNEQWWGLKDGSYIQMYYDHENGDKFFCDDSVTIDYNPEEDIEGMLSTFINCAVSLLTESNIECVKISAETTTYSIKITNGNNVRHFYVEVKDNLLISINIPVENYSQVFVYDNVVTMPSKNGYIEHEIIK